MSPIKFSLLPTVLDAKFVVDAADDELVLFYHQNHTFRVAQIIFKTFAGVASSLEYIEELRHPILDGCEVSTHALPHAHPVSHTGGGSPTRTASSIIVMCGGSWSAFLQLLAR